MHIKHSTCIKKRREVIDGNMPAACNFTRNLIQKQPSCEKSMRPQEGHYVKSKVAAKK